jgi:hypothetical protein
VIASKNIPKIKPSKKLFFHSKKTTYFTLQRKYLKYDSEKFTENWE